MPGSRPLDLRSVSDALPYNKARADVPSVPVIMKNDDAAMLLDAGRPAIGYAVRFASFPLNEPLPIEGNKDVLVLMLGLLVTFTGIWTVHIHTCSCAKHSLLHYLPTA